MGCLELAEILKVFGIAIIAVTVTSVLKAKGTEITRYIPQITSIVILITSISTLIPLIKYIKDITSGSNVGLDTVDMLLTASCISFLGSVISDLCKENGENMLKNTVEFATNAQLMVLALPMIKELLSKATEILNV